MLLENHPYLSIYLLGCIIAFSLSIIKLVIVYWVIPWLANDKILVKNIKKIMPPDNKTFLQHFLLVLGVMVMEAAMSWVNVIVFSWQIFSQILKSLKEVKARNAAPEEIKLLRYPVRTNPGMTRETVWAHLIAIQIKLGELTPGESEMSTVINEIYSYYPSFQGGDALKKLDELDVMDSSVIELASNSLPA